jgi:hypothetical protein
MLVTFVLMAGSIVMFQSHEFNILKMFGQIVVGVICLVYDTMKSGRSLLNKLVASRVKFSFYVASCVSPWLALHPRRQQQ